MEQVLSYFKEAEKLLQANEFETKEEFDAFIRNVFTEVDGMEKRLSCHHDGSMILEKFISHATAFQVRVFFDKISGEMAKLSVHRYASHVIEALIKRSGYFLEVAGYVDEEAEGLITFSEMIIRLSTEIGQSFDEVVFCSWGSHVYRNLLSLLSNIEGFGQEVEVIFENVSASEGKFLRDMCYNQYASPALQAIIETAHKQKSTFLPAIISTIIGDFETVDSKRFVQKASNNDCASHVIEMIVKSLDSSSFLSFYTKLIHPTFADFINGTPSNFLIQHLISACHSEAQIGIVLADLKPFLDSLVDMKRVGILVRLVHWSVEHKGAAEEVILSSIFTAFHAKSTTDKKSIFEKVSRLQTELDTYKPYVSLGCSLLSAIAGLCEQSMKPFVDNLLDLDAAELERLALHPQASRTLEAFIFSGKLSEKAISRLVRKLSGRFATLAADRSASHVVEKAWAASKADLKNMIMSELVAAKKRLEDSAHGRLVLRNCRVAEYERRQEEWVKEDEAVERKRTYFADIIDEEPMKKKKKAKKTSEESLLLDEKSDQTGKLFL